jgi:methylase of polypeptide subunit release factors
LEVARINIKKHNLENKIISLESNLLSCFFEKNFKIFNDSNIKNIIITANLPYIKDLDYMNMDYSVINYEPKIALYG